MQFSFSFDSLMRLALERATRVSMGTSLQISESQETSKQTNGQINAFRIIRHLAKAETEAAK